MRRPADTLITTMHSMMTVNSHRGGSHHLFRTPTAVIASNHGNIHVVYRTFSNFFLLREASKRAHDGRVDDQARKSCVWCVFLYVI